MRTNDNDLADTAAAAQLHVVRDHMTDVTVSHRALLHALLAPPTNLLSGDRCCHHPDLKLMSQVWVRLRRA
jgi:hypothetical protein